MPQLDKLIFFDQALLASFFFAFGYVYTRCFILPGLSLFFKIRSRFKKYWLNQILQILGIFLPTNTWVFNRSLAVFVFTDTFFIFWSRQARQILDWQAKNFTKLLWVFVFTYINIFENKTLINDIGRQRSFQFYFDKYAFFILTLQTDVLPTIYSTLSLSIEYWFKKSEKFKKLLKTTLINTNDNVATTARQVSGTTTHLLLEPTSQANVDQSIVLRRPAHTSELGRSLYSAFSVARPSNYIYTILGLRHTFSISSPESLSPDVSSTVLYHGESFSERPSNSTGGNPSELYLHPQLLWLSVGSRTGDQHTSERPELAIQLQVVSLPGNFSELGLLSTLSGYVAFNFLFNNPRHTDRSYDQDVQSSSVANASTASFTGHAFNVAWQTALVFNDLNLSVQRHIGYVFGCRCPHIFDDTKYYPSDSTQTPHVLGAFGRYPRESEQPTITNNVYAFNNDEYNQFGNPAFSRIICLSYVINSAVHAWTDAILSSLVPSNPNRRPVVWTAIRDGMARGVLEFNGSITRAEPKQWDVTQAGSFTDSTLPIAGQSNFMNTGIFGSDRTVSVILQKFVTKDFISKSWPILCSGSNLYENNYSSYSVKTSSLFWVGYELLVGEF